MKKSKIYSLLTVLLFVLFFQGCDKVKLSQKIEVEPLSNARVKFGYFSPYSATTNRGVQIKVNDIRVSNLLTYSISFPGGGFNQGGQTYADYISVNATAGTPVGLRISIPALNTNSDSVTLFNGTVNITPGVKQTVMFTDTAANTQATVLNDETADPIGANAKFKFFNGIPNGGNIDFYIVSSAGTFLAASNVPYKGVSNYFETPVSGLGSISFSMVRAGMPLANANLIGGGTSTGHPYSATALLNGRVYNVNARGYNGTTLTDARRPQPSITPIK